MLKIFLVIIGGGLGAATRYLVTLGSVRLFGASFPWGTLIVNLSGCFLIGAVFAFSEKSLLLSPNERLLIMTGFLGGLTTFSSFGLESINSLSDGAVSVAAINILANNVGGLLMVIAGMFITKIIH
ncbi:MAG: camphor resistance protein CrcB [Lentisphaerae bacterium GWF2_44_16]|nr:MAG: camphor resistance protein CrcB [Lentisphaerae bacterium GWF2_44_16]